MASINPALADSKDPLRRFRDEFVIEDENLIYLDGNSLGRMPKRAAQIVREVVELQWGNRLVRGWNEGWVDLPARLGAKIAGLIGAKPNEVRVSDSTSVNLYKLAMAAIQARPGRSEIVTDEHNFPSDLYVLKGVAATHGLRVRTDGVVTSNAALLSLSHVTFKSGELYNMDRLTREAHAAGAMVLWDLSHSVGAVPIDLNGCGVDLAVGCSYKYLCGGPGSPAFMFVRADLHEELRSPIQGWFGQHDPFAFGLEYTPAVGIDRFMVGTPPVISMAAMEAGIDLVKEAGIKAIREKSVRQTEYLIELWQEHLQPLGMSLNTPKESQRRGSHVSLGHPEALAIDLALIREMNVIPDFRVPDNIRYASTPLVTTYRELNEGVLRLAHVIQSGRFQPYTNEQPGVT